MNHSISSKKIPRNTFMARYICLVRLLSCYYKKKHQIFSEINGKEEETKRLRKKKKFWTQTEWKAYQREQNTKIKIHEGIFMFQTNKTITKKKVFAVFFCWCSFLFHPPHKNRFQRITMCSVWSLWLLVGSWKGKQ